MNATFRHTLNKLLITCIFGLGLIAASDSAGAFPLDTYATRSRLAEGKWVKISVANSGMHLITNANLRSWGFSDPSKVRIYGYGGQRINDVLTIANYIDDLPLTPSMVTSRGVAFYGVGPETWKHSSGEFTHTLNPFSTVGYYFITEESDPEAATPTPTKAGTGGASNPTTTFTDYLFHEIDQVKIGETGHLLLGEDFKWTRSRTFNFNFPDIASDSVTMKCSFVSKVVGTTSLLTFTANGSTLDKTPTDEIRATGTSSHNHGEATLTSKRIEVKDSKLTLGIAFSTSGIITSANLNYLEFNYDRHLKMTNGLLRFDISDTRALLSGATASTHVWDVTDPLNIYEMNTSVAEGGISWTNDYTGMRRYVAWDESASLPSPAFVGNVANQNLHDTSDMPDMVIFTLNEWESEARRIALLHENSADSLKVKIVNQNEVFNEFGSGSPDVNTFRRYLKMLYDRGNEGGRPLRYALFMGKPTYDNRRLSDAGKSLTYPTMPTWQSDTSLDDNVSFTTDDIFAFLHDGSGRTMGSDELCIAVGRIPVKYASDAKAAVDKLYEYVNRSSRTSWRNQVLFLADDENNGIHMEQSEDTYNGMLSGDSGDQFFYTKVYTDAFDKRNGTYPEARERMYNRLDEGLLWWNYIGHANPNSWTSEGMLTFTDMNNLFVRDYPVLYAATCEFLNWDSTEPSGAEVLYYNPQGGIIAAITAVRPVYISDNGLLGKAISPKIFNRDEDGRFLTLGEIYRQGKNNIRDGKGQIANNTNKLRYVLMGDPAMRFATPTERVVLERIDGEVVDPEAQITIKARQSVILEGYVCDYEGNLLQDFNGDLTVDMYDAEHSTTSNGYGDGKQVTFEEQGAKIYTGRDSISAGRFKMRVAMPETVANNFRPAAINMFARADDGRNAIGVNRDFYVFGLDTDAEPDDEAPVIKSIYMNHPSFVNGGTVNSNPVLIAEISENIGFNLSSAGIGHSMSIQIDGKQTFNNVAQYFTPDMGSLSGKLVYPFDLIMPGNHTLRLRVWDTSGNSADANIEFFVEPGAEPTLYDIYSDANPASTQANFYLVHDRPQNMMTVTVEVFNLMGRLVWSSKATGRSDMFTSVPITWDLTDMGGHRVSRGIYLYRATITESDGEQHVTKSSRLAVTGK